MANHFLDYIYIQIGKKMWQIILKDYIYKLAKDIGKLFFRLYIYTNWQNQQAKCLKFIHTIIDNYRCKIE